MPATPFHFGPAALLKTILRDRFSFTVFVIVQIGIDVEVGVRIVTGSSTLHAVLHTFLGAFLLSLVLLVPAKFFTSWIKRLVLQDLEKRRQCPAWLQRELGPVTWTGALTGAVLGGIGGITHVWGPVRAIRLPVPRSLWRTGRFVTD